MSGPRAGGDPVDEIDALVRGPALGCEVRRVGWWLGVRRPGEVTADHGWKLHVSARPSSLPAVLEKLVPVLLAEGCAFKVAASTRVLAELNDGITAPAGVGKAVTIYPRPDRVRPLGLALVDLLRGFDGPRVVSDRRIDPGAPVYYRYGPFTADWRAKASGEIGLLITGPHGEVFDGAAEGRYRQPSWVRDPFPDAVDALPDAGLVLGGRYAVTEGIMASGRGNVYRATDDTGRSLIVKQGRAMVAEATGELDSRMRLRNERRILQLLDGVDGVPTFVDHFSHAADEYLVITDEGPENLREDLHRDGPYRLDDGPRSLRHLARELATILHEVHSRGVVMRDLKPGNIIVRADGVSLIDFGIAAHDGLHLPGRSPGYAPQRQCAEEPPLPSDDLYALGMTLLEALTGLPPVHGVSAADARTKALETVRAYWGATADGVLGAAIDLTHDDRTVAQAAADRLRTGTDDRAAATLPPPPVAAEDTMAELADVLLDQLTQKVDATLTAPRGRTRPNPALYAGPAGIGMELLRHREHPGARNRIARLVEQAIAEADALDLPPGLLSGRTGVDMFVRQAQESLGLPATGGRRPAPASDEFDLVAGEAGIGLGHLWFYECDGDPADLAVVERCVKALATVSPDEPGLAHGLAGVLLLELVAAEHVEVDPALIDARIDTLIGKARTMIARAHAGSGTELVTTSWCNGLTGVARALLEAGERGDRPECTRVAMAAGDALVGWLPRSMNLGQCCGIAGIGDFLLDLSTVEGGDRFAEHATACVRQILLRSAGTHDRPEPVSFSATDPDGVSWAVGLSGILGFVRRLRDHGGPRLIPPSGQQWMSRTQPHRFAFGT